MATFLTTEMGWHGVEMYNNNQRRMKDYDVTQKKCLRHDESKDRGIRGVQHGCVLSNMCDPIGA
jgi:hypothetical protein